MCATSDKENLDNKGVSHNAQRIPNTDRRGTLTRVKGYINPLHPNISMHILHTVFCTIIQLVIISFILMTLLCDTGVILLGEIRC